MITTLADESVHTKSTFTIDAGIIYLNNSFMFKVDYDVIISRRIECTIDSRKSFTSYQAVKIAQSPGIKNKVNMKYQLRPQRYP